MIKKNEREFVKLEVESEESIIIDMLRDQYTAIQNLTDAVLRLRNAPKARNVGVAQVGNTSHVMPRGKYKYFYRGRTGLYLKNSTFKPLADLNVGESYDITHIAQDGRKTLKEMNVYVKTFGANRRHKLRVKDNYLLHSEYGRMFVTRTR